MVTDFGADAMAPLDMILPLLAFKSMNILHFSGFLKKFDSWSHFMLFHPDDRWQPIIQFETEIAIGFEPDFDLDGIECTICFLETFYGSLNIFSPYYRANRIYGCMTAPIPHAR